MSLDLRDRIADLERTVEYLREGLVKASRYTFIPVTPWQGFADTLEAGNDTEVMVLAAVHDPTGGGWQKWLVQYDDGEAVLTGIVDQVCLKPFGDDRRVEDEPEVQDKRPYGTLVILKFGSGM